MALANATLSTSPTSVFTSANADGSAVVAIVIANMDAGALQVDVHACPSAEANSIENLLFSINIPSGDSYVFNEKLILSNTDDIKVLLGSASTDCSCTVSYLDL